MKSENIGYASHKLVERSLNKKAGAHKVKKNKSRQEIKIRLRKEEEA